MTVKRHGKTMILEYGVPFCNYRCTMSRERAHDRVPQTRSADAPELHRGGASQNDAPARILVANSNYSFHHQPPGLAVIGLCKQ